MKFLIPEYGTKRVKKTFLLFPLRIDHEVRWLEFVKIEQEYTKRGASSNSFMQWLFLDAERWYNERFI